MYWTGYAELEDVVLTQSAQSSQRKNETRIQWDCCDLRVCGLDGLILKGLEGPRGGHAYMGERQETALTRLYLL
jgi:hypothetical protein